jgi:hypothetical protein
MRAELAVCSSSWHIKCVLSVVGCGIPSLRCHLIVLFVRCHRSGVLFCCLASHGVMTAQSLESLFLSGTNDVSNAATRGSRGFASNQGVWLVLRFPYTITYLPT